MGRLSVTNRLVRTTLSAIALVAVAAAQTTAKNDTKELFKWFDTLGFTAVSNGKFVQVDPCYFKETDRLIPPAPISGFVKSDDRRQLTIVTPELNEEVFLKHLGKQGDRGGRVKPADLSAWIDQNKERIEPKQQMFGFSYANFGLLPAARTFVVARACEARGLSSQSLEIMDYLEAQVHAQHRKGWSRTVPSIIKEALAEKDLYETAWDFKKPEVTRPTLLRRYDAFLKSFPDFASYGEQESREFAYVLHASDVLRRMIVEDESHANRAIKPYRDLSTEDQIDECIFELRDLRGRQMTVPGGVDVFQDERGPNSPASRLASFGLKAVPKLIQVLDSDNLTRSVEFAQWAMPDQLVMPEGSAVIQILGRIAGRSFDYPLPADPQARQDLVRRANIRDWWDEVQKSGELATLRKYMLSDQTDCADSAAVLVQKYPDQALEAIRPALSAVKQDWIRWQLVDTLSKLDTPACRAFMKDEMLNSSDPRLRLVGARVVTKTDPQLAFNQLIDIWNHANQMGEGMSREISLNETVLALAVTERPEAVDALANGFRNLPGGVRALVIRQFSWDLNLFYGHVVIIGGPPSESDRREYKHSVETLLGKELDDQDYAYEDPARAIDPEQLPRISDLACAALAARFPRKYKFDNTATRDEKARELTACQNTWRRENGEPLVEVPSAAPVFTRNGGVIDSVQIDGQSSMAPDLAARFQKLRGAKIGKEAVLSILREAVAHWPTGVTRLRVAIERDPNSAAILRVSFNPPGQQPGQRGWQYDQGVRLNGISIAGSSGSVNDSAGLIDTIDQSFTEPFRMISSVPSSASLEIHFVLMHSNP